MLRTYKTTKGFSLVLPSEQPCHVRHSFILHIKVPDLLSPFSD